MSQNSLPKPDGTTSTNYGAPFEISTVAIYVLRCLKQGKAFTARINYTEYDPWDDVVDDLDSEVLCVQLKHNEKLDSKKLKICLDSREALLKKHNGKSLLFVYFATSSESTLSSSYTKVKTYPEVLNMLLTNKSAVYLDQNDTIPNTYLCMSQNTVSSESTDVKEALVYYIGQHYLTNEHLKDIQIKFMDYINKRYLRLIKGETPLMVEEIRLQLCYAILNKFKLEYNPNQSKVEVSNNFEDVLETCSVVVFNHRWSSAFKEQIWSHLMLYLEKRRNKKHLKSSHLNDLWTEGKMHMPIVSPNEGTDKIILRALEIGDFKPKIIILRPRVFTIKPGQEIITILQNLNVNQDRGLSMKTKEDVENFKFSHVDLLNYINNPKLKLHRDSFTELSRNYFKKSSDRLQDFIEAHDEFNYVNDFNSFEDKFVPALFPTIKVKNISVDIIQQLLDLGSNVNASVEGIRPIFYAIEEDRPDIVELLLKNKAEKDPADKNGVRPLFIASTENKIEIAKLLIDYGAERKTADFYGVTPLFMAYNNGNYDIFRLLLKDNVHAVAANTIGSHILHKIAEDRNIEGLKCLIESCPDVNIFMTGDVKGKTPLDIAKANGNIEFVEMLQNALN